MKLLGYELRKLAFQRIGLLLIAVLWIAGQVLFYNQTRVFRGSRKDPGAWEQFYEGVEGKDNQEAYEWIDKTCTEIGMDPEFWYGDKRAFWNVLMDERDVYRYLAEYPGYIRDVLSQLEGMKSSPLFLKGGRRFAMQNIDKTYEAFLPLEGTAVSADAPALLSDALSDRNAVVLLMAQIALLAVCLFGAEQDSGKKMLITMQYRGRIQAAAAKVLCMVLGSLLLTLLLYGGFLVQVCILTGDADWDVPVQSLQELRRCVWQLSCREFAAAFLGNKILAMAVLGLFFSMCICLFKTAGGILAGCAVLLGEVLLRELLPETVEWLWARHLNLVSWADTWEWMHEYINVSLFGTAVSTTAGFYGGMLAGTAVFGGMALFFFPKEVQIGSGKLTGKLAVLFRKLWSRPSHTVSLVLHHGCQMYCSNKRYLLFAAVIAAMLIAARIRGVEEYYSLPQATYDSYMKTIQGPYTKETKQFLEKEEAHLNGTDGYEEELAAKLENGELSQWDYEGLLLDLDREKQQKHDGFLEVSKAWWNVKTVDGLGYGKAGFFHGTLADELFRDRTKAYTLIGLVFLLVLLFIAPYSSGERPCEDLFLVSARGRSQRLLTRLCVNMVTAFLLGAGMFVCRYISILNAYPSQEYEISAACLPVFTGLDARISVGGVLAASWAAKGIGLLLVAVTVTGLSMLKPETVSYYVLLAAFLGVPVVLCLLRTPADWFSLVGFFRLEELLAKSLWGCIAYVLVWGTGIMAGFAWIWRRVIHTGEQRETGTLFGHVPGRRQRRRSSQRRG